MIAIVAALFIFILLAVVSEASDDSDAATVTFDPGEGYMKRNDVNVTSGFYTMDTDYWSSYQITIPGTQMTKTSGGMFNQTTTTYYYYKDGFKFAGWLNPNDNRVYQKNDTGTFRNATTLVAQWEPYKITYLPNGGTSPSSSTGYYVQTSTEGTLVVPNNVFTRNGVTYNYLNERDVTPKQPKTFMGWALTSNGSVKYVCGDVLNTPTEDYNLYAVWADGCKIIFDSNGGDSPDLFYSPDVDGPLYVPGDHFTANGIEYTYSKKGYDFVGWSIDRNATSALYTRGNILPSTETGYVLYAVWKPNSLMVTFVYDSLLGYDSDLSFVEQNNAQLTTAEIKKAKVVYNFNIDSVSPTIQGDDSEYLPDTGFKFVKVQIVVRNNSVISGYSLALSKLNLYCSDGNVYRYDVTGTHYFGGANNISNISLSVGSSKVYYVIYQIPSDVNIVARSCSSIAFSAVCGRRIAPKPRAESVSS